MQNNNRQMENLVGEKKLMYDIIFGENMDYEIPILEYIEEMNDIDDFTSKVVSNLIASGVKIKEDILVLTADKKVWVLKIER
jgi:hypothetical protein